MAAKLFVRLGNYPKNIVKDFTHRVYLSTSCVLLHNLSGNTFLEHRNEPENFDTLGTWDNRIDLPLLLQASIKHGKPIPKISVENVGTASVIGRRTTNEDRFR